MPIRCLTVTGTYTARDRLGDPRRPAAGRDGGDGAGRESPDLEGAVALRTFGRRREVMVFGAAEARIILIDVF